MASEKAIDDSRCRPVVAHFANTYCKLSQNWIRTQVEHLAAYRPIILTLRTENILRDYPHFCYALAETSRIEWIANRVFRRLFQYFPSFFLKARQHRATLIHAHFGQNGYAMIPLAKALGVPLVTTFYGEDASGLPRQSNMWMERYRVLFDSGTYFLVEGQYLGSQLVRLGCPESKILTQHLGVDLEALPYKERSLAAGEPLRVLVAGRFTEKKGTAYAVDAFAEFISTGGKGVMTIFGDADTEKPENMRTKNQILNAIRKNGLRNRIDLRGMQPIDRLREAYYEHHVFLSPSVQAASGDNEGGAPVSLIEASATGMPVISSYHCDIPEVIQDGKTGLLAPEGGTAHLSSHLHFLFSKPEEIKRFGLNASRHAQEQYDAQKQARRLERIYSAALAT